MAAVSVLLVAQPGAVAPPPDALPFAKSYSVTGNYVVGGVDLVPRSGGKGFLTGTIPMSGVPENAVILTAFLFWETISTNISQVDGAKFRGAPVTIVKASSKPLTGNTSACWASGGGKNAQYTASMFRADVLHLLPPQVGANGTPSGKRLVNDEDLLEQGLALHTVTLPETGTGNGVPQSAGATLFVVYLDPAEPLTRIVLYDGISIQAPGVITTQTIRGFLQSSADPRAKITHIVGSGAPNKTDRLLFNGSPLATDALQLGASPASDRGWSNPTFNVSRLMPGAMSAAGYGEEVTTAVDHGMNSPYDCLAWAAIICSTTVKDTDDDGYPDLLESSTTPLKGPDGQTLPDMRAMGATPRHKDIFIEVGGMKADPGTSYGSGGNRVTDTHGHSHLPSPAVLKNVGDAFAHAPVVNADGVPGISVHFAVGSPLGYHGLGGAYTSLDADSYLVPEALARGGEIIKEVACVSTPTRPCQFPDYPGTVSWKIGYQFLRDAPVRSDGGGNSPRSRSKVTVRFIQHLLDAAASDLIRTAPDQGGRRCDHRHSPDQIPRHDIGGRHDGPGHAIDRVGRDAAHVGRHPVQPDSVEW